MSYSALTDPYGLPDPSVVNAGGALNAGTNVNAFANCSLEGVENDDDFYTFLLSGTFAVPALDIGKAVSIDITAPNTAKLCVAGDIILGQVKSIEIRTIEGIKTGAVMTEGGAKLPIDTTGGAVAPIVGDSVQGGTIPGTVVKLAAAHGRSNVVMSVDLVGHTCVVLFL